MKQTASVLIFFGLALTAIVATGGVGDGLALGACLLCLVLFIVAEQTTAFLLQYFFLVFLYLALFPFYLQSLAGFEMNLTGQPLFPMSLRSFVAISLFLLAVAASGLATRAPVRKGPDAHATWDRFVQKKLGVPTVALIAITGLAVVSIGSDLFFTSRNVFYAQHGPQTGVVVLISNVVRTVPCWVLFFLLWRAVRADESLLKVRYLAFFLLIVLMSNPITTPRYISLTGILLALSPVLVAKRRRAVFIVLFPLLLGVLIPLSSILRGGFSVAAMGDLARLVLAGGEFSSIMLFNDWMSGNQGMPMTLGLTTLSAVGIFVPRALWPGKNPGTGPSMAEELGYSHPNVAVTPVAEFFMDFGWLGIVVAGTVLGFVFRRVRPFDRRQVQGFGLAASLPAILFALMPILIRGDLGLFFNGLYSFALSQKIACWILRLRL